MKGKTFLISTVIIAAATILFTLPADSLPLIIPSLLFAGISGGIYVGHIRKRPLISCIYDGLIVGVPASLIQAAIATPILWFLHDLRTDNAPLRFTAIIFAASILLCGIAGGPFGGLAMGLYYRYIKRDRGEGELYEAYIEEKTKKSNDKKSLDF